MIAPAVRDHVVQHRLQQVEVPATLDERVTCPWWWLGVDVAMAERASAAALMAAAVVQ